MSAGRTRVQLLAAATAAALVLTACDHSTPFEPPDSGRSGPLVGGDPARLTYGGTAHAPSWTPDGETLLFSFVDGARDDADRCVGQLPRAGGTIIRTICHSGALTTDSLDQLTLPALSGAGELAFVRASRRLGSIVDRERLLLVAAWDDPSATRVLRGIPFTSGGTLRSSIASLGWIDGERLAFIANAEFIALPCPLCDPIVVESGRDIIVLDPATAPAFTVVPVPGNPTSVSGSGADLYYTLAGDSRLYRGSVGGAASVVHDFAELGVVRGVHVAGNRLVAVVGGGVETYETDEGIAQRDEGGQLWIMDLPAGTPTPIVSLTHLFREPRLSPDGGAIIATGVPFDEVVIYEGLEPVGIVLVVDGPPDLWRFGE